MATDGMPDRARQLRVDRGVSPHLRIGLRDHAGRAPFAVDHGDRGAPDRAIGTRAERGFQALVGGGVGRRGDAGRHRGAHGHVEHGKAVGEGGRALRQGGDTLDGDTLRGQEVGVAEDDEGRPLVLEGRPGLGDDLRADAGRVAQSQGDRRGHAV